MKIMFFLRIRTFYLCDLNIALSLKKNSENDSKKRVKKIKSQIAISVQET